MSGRAPRSPATRPHDDYHRHGDGSPGLGPDTHIHTRDAAATGEHRQWLVEAGGRVDAVTQLLAAAALDHVDIDDVANCLPHLVQVLDAAGRLIHLAGEDDQS